MELTWKASESASSLAAATCLSAGLPVADERLAAAFAPAVEVLLAEFAACGAAAEQLLPMLTGLAARGVEDNRQLVEQALTKTVGSRSPLAASLGRLAGAIGGLEAGFQNAYRAVAGADAPPPVDEVAQRGRWLIEQWETNGSGLLLQIARSTDATVIAATAEVALVYPLVGGHGAACRPLNSVTLEAVADNVNGQLPEVLRLAWLVGQLNLDLPMYADPVPPAHRVDVGACALVPPVLAAAETIEMATLSSQTLAAALSAWRLVPSPEPANVVASRADTLLTWWRTYDEGQTPWSVALAALDAMLFPTPDQP